MDSRECAYFQSGAAIDRRGILHAPSRIWTVRRPCRKLLYAPMGMAEAYPRHSLSRPCREPTKGAIEERIRSYRRSPAQRHRSQSRKNLSHSCAKSKQRPKYRHSSLSLTTNAQAPALNER